jgi:hypothetical protein
MKDKKSKRIILHFTLLAPQLKRSFILLGSFFILIFTFFIFATPVFAAEFFFDAQNNEWRIGDEIAVSFFLNTNGDDINAIEGRISYPKELLELREIRDGNSIVNFWIEKPRIRSGEVAFSGVTPGGYKGKNGLLFSLMFRASKEGKGIIEIRDLAALKNDGKGTAADVRAFNLSFLISKEAPETQQPRVKDVEPPESFTPQVARDPALFDGKWFLVFASQDKGAGIDRYEIKESRQKILSIFSSWVPAESPYLLKDQELRSYVFVKAIDKAGNARIEKISPRNPLQWYENYENWIMIIVGVLIVILTLRIKRHGTRDKEHGK